MKQRAVRRLFYRGYASHDHIDVDDGSDPTGVMVANAFTDKKCPNCNSTFATYSHETKDPNFSAEAWTYVPANELLFCNKCGWWQLRQEGIVHPPREKTTAVPMVSNYAYQYHSILEHVDIASNEIICADLRAHLLRCWGDRKLISASKAEELVKDVLKDHLQCDIHHATANTNAPDGGIDLYVCAENGKIRLAVQVKRRVERDVEGVEAIRNFIGALVLEGYSKGIFVTTATRFSCEAERIAANTQLKRHDLELQLIDGEALLELLSVTSPQSEIALPPIIKRSTEWIALDGSTHTTEDLLHG
jgi:restriction system protein